MRKTNPGELTRATYTENALSSTRDSVYKGKGVTLLDGNNVPQPRAAPV